MQKPGWRPERRNRKIGTPAAGYSKQSDMRIPQSWPDRHGHFSAYYEWAEPDFAQKVVITGKPVLFIFEVPREGFTYGCTPADILHLFSLIPLEEWQPTDFILFRQPTRKQTLLKPVWGRCIYRAEVFGKDGSAIVIEAQKVGAKLVWPRKCKLEDRDELERLKQDGHQFESDKRRHVATLTQETIRSTILYRTFLHELGHWENYRQDVLNPQTRISKHRTRAEDLYYSRPASERESFAHSFAQKLEAYLKARNEIPFAPKEFDPSQPMQVEPVCSD